MKILESASKIVFILIALTTCVSLFFGLLEAKDFMVLAGMTFAFYFSHKGDNGKDYLGK